MLALSVIFWLVEHHSKVEIVAEKQKKNSRISRKIAFLEIKFISNNSNYINKRGYFFNYLHYNYIFVVLALYFAFNYLL